MKNVYTESCKFYNEFDVKILIKGGKNAAN